VTTVRENLDDHAGPVVSPRSLPPTEDAPPSGREGAALNVLRMRDRRAGRDDAPANDHSRRHTVSVVIPALNEEENIAWVLERIPPIVDEVIVVDGHSRDRTVEVARTVRPGVVVVPQRFRGKGDAVRVALGAATCDLVVMLDADGSMEPGEIHRFVTPLMNGYDFVKGSRFLAGGGSTDLTTIRELGNNALVRLANYMFFIRFTDLCYGFCSFRRECLPALALTAHGFEIETELVVHALKANLRIAEVPSTELPRRGGVSNLHAVRDGLRVLRTLVRERLVRAPRPVVDPIDQRVLNSWHSAVRDLRSAVGQREPVVEGNVR
jgi:glycosyltransferase involved in cell wall biosynthesis